MAYAVVNVRCCEICLRFTNGADLSAPYQAQRELCIYLVSMFAGMYRIGKLLSTASYPMTNPDLTAILLKLIHKCSEKEEYFSFARLRGCDRCKHLGGGEEEGRFERRTAEYHFVKLFPSNPRYGDGECASLRNSGVFHRHTSSLFVRDSMSFCLLSIACIS